MRLALKLTNYPYLGDHRVEGRAVYPAVESLERLAEAVSAHCPGQEVLDSRDAEFLRFLELPAGKPEIDAVADIEVQSGGSVAAALGTVAQGPVSRVRDHARVTFADTGPFVPLSPDSACAAEGICFGVPAGRLYAELVPFGPSFQNAAGTLFLFQDGAVAELKAPDIASSALRLGSPFVLDAAFHAACAWGQRYAGYIAFPVGYARRTIVRPTASGQTYFCRVVPAGVQKDTLDFDLWIYDSSGSLCEAVSGVRMKDVFKGKIPVPAWIQAAKKDGLRAIREKVSVLSVVELASMLPFAEKTLTSHELSILQKRRQKKRNRHLGARIALKRVSRGLYDDGVPDDPALIETIAPDDIHPACSVPGNPQRLYCSASHDSRFAVAVGGRYPVGVDVEQKSETLLKGMHVYMTPAEQTLCGRSPLGLQDAAIRVWTAKECAAKALDIPLTSAWKEIALQEIGEDRSIVTIRGKAVESAHASVDDHVFTVLEIPEV